MKTELECKIKLNPATRAKLVTRLEKIAVKQGTVFEQNWLFDRNDELNQRGEILRVRVGDRQSWGTLTHKKPLPETTYKTRDETECKIDNVENYRVILAAQHYLPIWYYEKYRTTWVYEYAGRTYEIVMDTLPELGDFVEIEAADNAALDALLATLNLNATANTRQSYGELWREHCQTHPANHHECRFKNNNNFNGVSK